MMPNIRVMPWYFLIQFDKELIKQKRTLPGNLLVPDTDESGKHSLCYGKIVQVGTTNKGEQVANKKFPEAQVGDTAILQHWVETEQPIHADEKYFYVPVHDDEYNIKGIEKPDGTLIAHPSNIFCFDPEKMKEKGKIVPLDHSQIPQPRNWNLSESGLFLFDGSFEDAENIREKIEEVELHSKHIAEGLRSDTAQQRIAEYQKEGEKLTRQLNERVVHELTALFMHPTTEKELSGITQSDHIFALGWPENKGYELNYKGVEFVIIRTKDVLFGLKKALVGRVKVA